MIGRVRSTTSREGNPGSASDEVPTNGRPPQYHPTLAERRHHVEGTGLRGSSAGVGKRPLRPLLPGRLRMHRGNYVAHTGDVCEPRPRRLPSAPWRERQHDRMTSRLRVSAGSSPMDHGRGGGCHRGKRGCRIRRLCPKPARPCRSASRDPRERGSPGCRSLPGRPCVARERRVVAAFPKRQRIPFNHFARYQELDRFKDVGFLPMRDHSSFGSESPQLRFG